MRFKIEFSDAGGHKTAYLRSTWLTEGFRASPKSER